MRIGKQSALRWAFDEFDDETPQTYIDMKGSIKRVMEMKHRKKEKAIRAFKKTNGYEDVQQYERYNRKQSFKRKKTSRIVPLQDEHIRGIIPGPEGVGNGNDLPTAPVLENVHSPVPELSVHIPNIDDRKSKKRF